MPPGGTDFAHSGGKRGQQPSKVPCAGAFDPEYPVESMFRPSRLVLVSLLCIAIPAQEPAKSKAPKGGEAAAQGKLDKPKQEGSDGDDPTQGKAAPAAPSGPVFGARGYCRIESTVRPAKLLPGQTGKALITMMFEGDAVMTAPGNVEVKLIGNPGPLTFGPAVLLPAQPGRLAKAFLGQPVYDNWAVLEMPVTMGQNMPLGSKQNAGLAITFDLVNGKTAQPIGQFTERAFFAIEVGAARDPAVGMAAGPQPTSPASAPPQARKSVSEGQLPKGDARMEVPQQGGADQGAEPQVLATKPDRRERGSPQSAGGTPEDDRAPPQPQGSQGSVAILAGGAVVLLVVILVLMRKR